MMLVYAPPSERLSPNVTILLNWICASVRHASPRTKSATDTAHAVPFICVIDAANRIGIVAANCRCFTSSVCSIHGILKFRSGNRGRSSGEVPVILDFDGSLSVRFYGQRGRNEEIRGDLDSVIIPLLAEEGWLRHQ